MWQAFGDEIRVTLERPAGVEHLPGEIHAGGFGLHFGGAAQTRTVAARDVVELELRALQPDLRFNVWAMSETYPGALHDGELLVRAGQVVEATLVLQAGATVRGQVVDTTGAPLAGVEVRGDGGASYTSTPGRNVRTDADGRFRFDVSSLRGGASLVAWKEGHRTARIDDLASRVRTDRSAGEDLRLVLDGAPLRIRGVVAREDGEPASGAALLTFDRRLLAIDADGVDVELIS